MMFVHSRALFLPILAQANSWSQLSPDGSAPLPRYSHTAVWSPSADGFYIFGGGDGRSSALNDLHFYNRQANSWSQLSPDGSAPSPRFNHTAVWSPSADGFYIFGGYDVSFGRGLNDLHFYSRQANSWSQLLPNGSVPSLRYSHTAVWSPSADGFYIFGGYDTNFDRGLNDLHVYSRQANSWSQLLPNGSVPSLRYSHTAVWSPSADGFYIFGGWDGRSSTLNDLHFYSRQANSWSHLSPDGSAPSPRGAHAAVWSPSAEGLYLFGGAEATGGELNDLHFCMQAMSFAVMSAPPGTVPARSSHAAVWAYNGMYVFFGETEEGESAGMYFYHPQAFSWSVIIGEVAAVFTEMVRKGSTAVLADNGIYIFGGEAKGRYFNRLSFFDLQAVRLWDKFPSGTGPSARSKHTAISVNNEMYVFGGTNGSNVYNDLYAFNSQAEAWRALNPAGSVPEARCGHTAVATINAMYVFGGEGTSIYNDLYAYDLQANVWRALSPSGALPGARKGHAAVADFGGFYVLGGVGASGGYLPDVFFYDPEADYWNLIPSDLGRLAGHSAVDGDRIYVFGFDGSSFSNRVLASSSQVLTSTSSTSTRTTATTSRSSSTSISSTSTSSSITGTTTTVLPGINIPTHVRPDSVLKMVLEDSLAGVLEAALNGSHRFQKQTADGNVTGMKLSPTSERIVLELRDGSDQVLLVASLPAQVVNDATNGTGAWLVANQINNSRVTDLSVDMTVQSSLLELSVVQEIHGNVSVLEVKDEGDIIFRISETDPKVGDRCLWQNPVTGHWSDVRILAPEQLWEVQHELVEPSADLLGGTWCATNHLSMFVLVNIAQQEVTLGGLEVVVVLLGIFFAILCGSLLALQIRRMGRNKEFHLADPLAIKQFLLYADIGIVRLEFLQELLRTGGVLPRRQEAEDMHVGDLPALVTQRELETLEYDEEKGKLFQRIDHSDELPEFDDDSRIEVHLCSVSHVWEAMEHPGPWAFQLAEIVKHFEQLDGLVWIFFDYTSLYQYPRTSVRQKRSFQRALEHMHLFYAHDLVNVQVIDRATPEETKRIREKDHDEIQVYRETMGEDGTLVGELRYVKIQDLTLNDNPYAVRGWCQAEQQWANLREGVDDHVPMPPKLFEAMMDALKFTHRSDTAAVQLLQKKVFTSKVAEATRLTFSRLPENEVKVLCEALPHYSNLEVINVSNTQLSAEAVEAILYSRATLTMLVQCDLDDALVCTIVEVIEKQHVAVKTLDLGVNARVSQEARIGLELAAARKNIKLRLDVDPEGSPQKETVDRGDESVEELQEGSKRRPVGLQEEFAESSVLPGTIRDCEVSNEADMNIVNVA